MAWTTAPNAQYDCAIRRYDATGAPLDDDDVRLNSYFTGQQYAPVVSPASDGGFTFAWAANGPNPQGPQWTSIYRRHLNPVGLFDGDDSPVSTYVRAEQFQPSIAADNVGNVVFVWTDFARRDGSASGIFGRRFAAGGAPLGDDFQVNSYTQGFQRNSSVAASATGSFVVVWQSEYQDGSGYGIFGQRYDAGGVPTGPELSINSYTGGDQIDPVVAIGPGGDFIVAWSSDRPGADPGDDDVVARRYNASGIPQGDEFLVNAVTTGGQRHADVSFHPAGPFLIVWERLVPESPGVIGRWFEGVAPMADEFSVTESYAEYPRISFNAAGDFIVSWSAYTTGSSEAFARRFRSDLIFRDNFDAGSLSSWSENSTDDGDLSVSAAAALRSSTAGLQATVDDTAALYVQDDTPEDEGRYRARFYVDATRFDPGEAAARHRTRVFITFEENPTRRLMAVVLRRISGAYSLRGRVRLDDQSHVDTAFAGISAAEHFVEVDWRRASAPDANDGSFEIWVDGTSVATLTGLDNSSSSVDFARLGALSIRTGANGTLYWDEFESRRVSYIGP